VFGPYGAGAGSLQSLIARLSAFSSRIRRFGGKNVSNLRYLNTKTVSGRTRFSPVCGSRSFYVLLCMFNGFAFARPFCQAIKVSLTA
jgi:hypothetical protein